MQRLSETGAINKHLLTIVDIQQFLIEWRDSRFLRLGQFCLDWIEETLDRMMKRFVVRFITGPTAYWRYCVMTLIAITFSFSLRNEQKDANPMHRLNLSSYWSGPM